MPNSMLGYGKLILEKVSFDKKLFWKEYDKFCKVLRKEECKELGEWLANKYQGSPITRVDINK